MTNKRILRVITRLNVGGPAQQALFLTKALPKEFETKLLTGRLAKGEIEINHEDIPTTSIHLTREINPARDLLAYFDIRREINSFKPNLVHTHMAKAGAISRTAALISQNKPVLVHTFHGHVLEGYFSTAKQNMFIQLERHLARHTDILIAVSNEVRDELLDLKIGTVDKYRVIPVGLDLYPFLKQVGKTGKLRKKLGISMEDPLVGIIGRLTAIKDHATLFKSIALLRDVHLAVIGGGELERDLVILSHNYKIHNRVHFLGWQTQSLAELVSDLDIVVSSSLNEGTPLALIESLAAEKPVVATDVGGTSSVIQNGYSGFLIPPRNPEALAEKIQYLFNNPVLAHQMGINGRSYVKEKFSQDRLLRDITALYNELL